MKEKIKVEVKLRQDFPSLCEKLGLEDLVWISEKIAEDVVESNH